MCFAQYVTLTTNILINDCPPQHDIHTLHDQHLHISVPTVQKSKMETGGRREIRCKQREE